MRVQRAAVGRTREGRMTLCNGRIGSRAERRVELGGETVLSYRPPPVRPFLEKRATAGQGRSHVFSHIAFGIGKSI